MILYCVTIQNLGCQFKKKNSTWSAFTEHGSAGMACVRGAAKYSDPHMEKSKLLFNA